VAPMLTADGCYLSAAGVFTTARGIVRHTTIQDIDRLRVVSSNSNIDEGIITLYGIKD